MNFDHVRGIKIDSVPTVASRSVSMQKTIDEISKCDIVCCMGHRIRTWNRLNPENLITNLPEV